MRVLVLDDVFNDQGYRSDLVGFQSDVYCRLILDVTTEICVLVIVKERVLWLEQVLVFIVQ
jgi:hypothetical protein